MTSIVIRKPNSQGGLAPGDGQDAFHADAPLRRGEEPGHRGAARPSSSKQAPTSVFVSSGKTVDIDLTPHIYRLD